jgi:methylenetetrahydrofolate reductase (NADPH)
LHIPDEVDRRLRAVPADQVAEEGLRICVEIIEQIREIPGVSGVHVMAPGYEHGIPGILERAGLASGGAQRVRPPGPAGPRPRDEGAGPEASGGFQGGRPPGPAAPAPTLGGAGAD